jgi:hypothetical protein
MRFVYGSTYEGYGEWPGVRAEVVYLDPLGVERVSKWVRENIVR